MFSYIFQILTSCKTSFSREEFLCASEDDEEINMEDLMLQC